MLFKFVLSKKKKLSPTKKMERGKDSIDLDSKPLSKSSLLLNIEKKKVVRDFSTEVVVLTLMINTIGLYTIFGGK